jgi:hypothetical protein
MQKNTFGDPFSRQSVAEEEVLEEEIQQEMININRDKRNRLKLLKIKPRAGDTTSEEDLAAAEHRLHTKSAEKFQKLNSEESGGHSARKINSQVLNDNHGKKISNFKPIEHMRIYYKQNMELIQKDSEDMDEALMTKISKLTSTISSEYDSGYASETDNTPKSMLMIEEIDRDYEEFERVPMDSSTQTTEQIVGFRSYRLSTCLLILGPNK